jgi:hypothetical protein
MAMRFSFGQTPASLMHVMASCPSAFPGHSKVKPGAEYAARYARAAAQPLAVASPLAGRASDGAGGGTGAAGGAVVVVGGTVVVVVVVGDVVVVVVVGGTVVVVVVVGAGKWVVVVCVNVVDVLVVAAAPTSVPTPRIMIKHKDSRRTALPNKTVPSLTSRRRPCATSTPTSPSFWPHNHDH